MKPKNAKLGKLGHQLKIKFRTGELMRADRV
jgi:hypothetical protein